MLIVVDVLFIVKGVKRLKLIVAPTWRHENETYCIVSIYIIKIIIVALFSHAIIELFQIFKFSLGPHYAKFFLS